MNPTTNPWSDLYSACQTCEKCSLSETRTQTVFGVGNPQASILLIGEAPGETEDLQGEPFVGRSGRLLDEMLSVIDLHRQSNIFITNIVKCRPPKNRNPLALEQKSCLPHLRKQVALMRPKIIVCLGRVAATTLIRNDFAITKEHGEFFEKADTQMVALYHPAALLRDPRKKPDTFEDLQKLRSKILELCPETYS